LHIHETPLSKTVKITFPGGIGAERIGVFAVSRMRDRSITIADSQRHAGTRESAIRDDG
jgi:hypothetical protein